MNRLLDHISADGEHNIDDYSISDQLLLDQLTATVAEFARAACDAADVLPSNQDKYGTYMTRKELSRVTGVPADTISALVNNRGEHLPTLLTLARLARASGKKLTLGLGN